MATQMLLQLTKGKTGEYSKLNIKKNKSNAISIGVLKLGFKCKGSYLGKKILQLNFDLPINLKFQWIRHILNRSVLHSIQTVSIVYHLHLPFSNTFKNKPSRGLVYVQN